jgi:predicted peptidase
MDYEAALLELIAEAERRLGTSPRRVHLTGLSLGGMGAWYLGARHPKRFASVVPICGSVPPFADFPAAVAALRDVPVWAFHGVEDPVIPVAHTLALVETLRRAGGHPRLTLYADVGHTAWREAYADPALHGWFLGTFRR